MDNIYMLTMYVHIGVIHRGRHHSPHRILYGFTETVFQISRDRSRSRIKSCNPKNQIWDLSRNKWYLSQSGCGIKSGINTTFLARNCGSALTAQPRRTTTEPGVLGAWTILRDIGTSARNRRVIESTP